MRDSQIQTPQRDQTSADRRSKSNPDPTRSVRKLARKSLNPAFKTVSEGDTSILESPKEFSEVSDDNPFAESEENFIVSKHPVTTASSETFALYEPISPSLSSSITTVTSGKHVLVNDPNKWESEGPSKQIECIEAKMVIKHLKEARKELLRSACLSQSKKLLDALTTVVVEEFSTGLHEEKDWFDKILSRNAMVGFLTSMPIIVVILVFWFFGLGAEATVYGPTPT